MKNLFFLLLCLILPISAFASTSYTYKVEVGELSPLQNQSVYVNIANYTPDKYDVSVSYAGDWANVEHTTVSKYYGILHFERYNRESGSSKLATTVTITLVATKKVGTTGEGEDESNICEAFPVCPPPPPVTTDNFAMVSLVAILRPSADGNYLLLWTAADGGHVIPLYKGDRTARETLATARRRKPGR